MSADPPARLVSLVPSLTETLWDLNVGPWVVGVTRFCVRPAEARQGADVVGGTKDPDVPRIVALRPDLVLADEDENKPEHVEALRAAGVKVHVTRIASVEDVGRELVTIGRLLGRGIEAEGWQQRILTTRAEVRQVAAMHAPLSAFVPIWRRPLMTMNGATYLSDLLKAVGVENVFASARRKYFEVSLDEVRAQAPEVVLLPTEPYRFGERHRAEFAELLGLEVGAVAVVDGEALTWFGTHTVRGLEAVAEAAGRWRGRMGPGAGAA